MISVGNKEVTAIRVGERVVATVYIGARLVVCAELHYGRKQ